MIPDWAASSLRAAYKRFGHFSQRDFVEKALIDDGTGKKFRYSHAEEYPPVFGPGFDAVLETAEKTDEK